MLQEQLDYIEDFGRNRFKLHPSKMQFVLENREMWLLNLEQLPLRVCDPLGKAGDEKRSN